MVNKTNYITSVVVDICNQAYNLFFKTYDKVSEVALNFFKKISSGCFQKRDVKIIPDNAPADLESVISTDGVAQKIKPLKNNKEEFIQSLPEELRMKVMGYLVSDRKALHSLAQTSHSHLNLCLEVNRQNTERMLRVFALSIKTLLEKREGDDTAKLGIDVLDQLMQEIGEKMTFQALGIIRVFALSIKTLLEKREGDDTAKLGIDVLDQLMQEIGEKMTFQALGIKGSDDGKVDLSCIGEVNKAIRERKKAFLDKIYKKGIYLLETPELIELKQDLEASEVNWPLSFFERLDKVIASREKAENFINNSKYLDAKRCHCSPSHYVRIMESVTNENQLIRLIRLIDDRSCLVFALTNLQEQLFAKLHLVSNKYDRWEVLTRVLRFTTNQNFLREAFAQSIRGVFQREWIFEELVQRTKEQDFLKEMFSHILTWVNNPVDSSVDPKALEALLEKAQDESLRRELFETVKSIEKADQRSPYLLIIVKQTKNDALIGEILETLDTSDPYDRYILGEIFKALFVRSFKTKVKASEEVLRKAIGLVETSPARGLISIVYSVIKFVSEKRWVDEFSRLVNQVNAEKCDPYSLGTRESCFERIEWQYERVKEFGLD